MTAAFVGLIALLCGTAAGWLLRSEDVWRLEIENTRLLDDLDSAVRDIAATLGKKNHPAGRYLRSVR